MIMNIMLATLLIANSVDYQEIRVAIVLYAIAQVFTDSVILSLLISPFDFQITPHQHTPLSYCQAKIYKLGK